MVREAVSNANFDRAYQYMQSYHMGQLGGRGHDQAKSIIPAFERAFPVHGHIKVFKPDPNCNACGGSGSYDTEYYPVNCQCSKLR